LEKGSAHAAFDLNFGSYDSVDELAKKYRYRLFGRVPEIGHRAYAIGVSAREGDTDVGRPPRDRLLHKDELGDYVAPYSKDAEAFDLARLSGRNHLGGTMFPCQWTPKFSATYLEIEEHFGGFNFGGGNASSISSRWNSTGVRLSFLFTAHSQKLQNIIDGTGEAANIAHFLSLSARAMQTREENFK
jgi:hypothetical protein